MIKNNQRILDISKGLQLSHIGSNLSCLPVLEKIYQKKKPGDIVILDNAHAHLAHLMVKAGEGEIDFRRTDPEKLIKEYGIHCDRKAGCDASGGSLGHGLGIGIGYALSDRTRDVYVIVSDGSMMEGSNWEALRIKHDVGIDNLHIYCNFNGYTAVAKINTDLLIGRMKAFCPAIRVFKTKNGSGFKGIQGHYIQL